VSVSRNLKSLAGLSKRSSYWSFRFHAFSRSEFLLSFPFLMNVLGILPAFGAAPLLQVKCRPSTRVLHCSLAGLAALEARSKPTVLPCQACYRPNSCTSFYPRPPHPLPCSCRPQLCSNAGDPLSVPNYDCLGTVLGVACMAMGPGREARYVGGRDFRYRPAFATSRTHPLSINTSFI
jgi:hypothetical protein